MTNPTAPRRTDAPPLPDYTPSEAHARAMADACGSERVLEAILHRERLLRRQRLSGGHAGQREQRKRMSVRGRR